MTQKTYIKESYVHPKIELSEQDYKRILGLARANAKQIEKRARELYEQYGVYKVCFRAEIRNRTITNDSLVNTYELDCRPSSGYVYAPSMSSDTEKPLVLLSEEERKRILTVTANYVQSCFDARFGEHLTLINNAKKYEHDARRMKKASFIFTIIGWLLAFAFFVFLFQVGFHGK